MVIGIVRRSHEAYASGVLVIGNWMLCTRFKSCIIYLMGELSYTQCRSRWLVTTESAGVGCIHMISVRCGLKLSDAIRRSDRPSLKI